MPGMGAYTAHAARELGQIWRGGGAVLRQFVDHRSDRQQGLLGAEPLFIAENTGQFRQCQGSPFSQIIERDIDLVGRTHESEYILGRGLAEASGLLGQTVQLLARCPSVDLPELGVERLHVPGLHSGVFPDVGHLLLHRCVGLDSLPAQSDDTVEPADYHGIAGHERGLPLLEKPIAPDVSLCCVRSAELTESICARTRRIFSA